MKTLTALSIAVVMAFTGAAMAQNMNPDPKMPSHGVSDIAVGVGANVDFDGLMTTLGANAAVDLSTVNDGTTIRVLKLSALDQTVRAEDLDAALQANAAARTSWPSALEGNVAIKAKLDAEGVSAGDVIAIQGDADGSLTIWIDDRM